MRNFKLCSALLLTALLGVGQAGCMGLTGDMDIGEDDIEMAAAELDTMEEIAEVLIISNTTEIIHGRIALERASRPIVRELAEAMIADHTRANLRIADALAALGAAPEPSSYSRALADRGQVESMILQGVTAPVFDPVYIELQIAAHRRVLRLLDEVILPQAQNDRLSLSAATEFRATISAHLLLAESIREELGPREAPRVVDQRLRVREPATAGELPRIDPRILPGAAGSGDVPRIDPRILPGAAGSGDVPRIDPRILPGAAGSGDVPPMDARVLRDRSR